MSITIQHGITSLLPREASVAEKGQFLKAFGNLAICSSFHEWVCYPYGREVAYADVEVKIPGKNKAEIHSRHVPIPAEIRPLWDRAVLTLSARTLEVMGLYSVYLPNMRENFAQFRLPGFADPFNAKSLWLCIDDLQEAMEDDPDNPVLMDLRTIFGRAFRNHWILALHP